MNHLEHMAPSELQYRISALEAQLEVTGLDEAQVRLIEEELQETKSILQEHQNNSDFFNTENE